ncbi:MAG: hypothetical protein RLO51_16330 [Thalassobaculum sp.]|uniref:hypothetical protein n=1 Tax=Thalassobaculum sp. TaxID=2022740 RepID=UPI0032EE4FBF
MTDIDTTPATANDGTALTRFNAVRHGILSRYTVLPWEDAGEYRTLLSALVAEHVPEGPTEEHLVEELAGILWRKRRLRMAEGAAYRHGLAKSLGRQSETTSAALTHLNNEGQSEGVAEAVRATPADTDAELADLQDDERMTQRALKLLRSRRNDAYEAGLTEMRDDTREWWEDQLGRDTDELVEGEEPARHDAESLARFLDDEVLPWFANRRQEIANRSLIREQAYGEALDPYKLERLGRYEVHLDRKLERTLTMLIRLRDLRRSSVAG